MASTHDEITGEARKGLRVLVTGANGFVGKAIALRCASAGMRVSTTGRSERNSENLQDYFRADVTEPDALTEKMSGLDAVIHSAGLAHQFDKSQDESRFEAVNVHGTENVALSAIRAKVKHFVLISSVSVYGDYEGAACDERAPCRPQGAYAESKYQAEQRAIEIFDKTETCLTILRLATVYGEGDRGNVLRLIRSVDRRRFIWIGRGKNHKSLIHVDDVARACVAVLTSPCAGINIYNVSAPARTMREIVEGIAAALKRPAPRLHVPQGLALNIASILKKVAGENSKLGSLKAPIEKWLAEDVYDARKFQQQFGFETEMKLAEGLRREAAWYKGSVR